MNQLINSTVLSAELVIHTDGGSRGNPGPSAIGVVIDTPKGDHIESYGKYIGTATNNQAEYAAVISALKEAAKYQPKKIQFFLDSELVVKQLTGVYKVKHPEMRLLFHEIQSLITGLEVTFSHVMREQNQLADIEVNRALDAHEANKT